MNKRGHHNRKRVKVRLRGKSDPNTLTVRQYSFSAVSKSPVRGKSQWMNALEAEWHSLKEFFSLSAAHSILSYSHSLVEGLADQQQTLPPLTESYLIALIFVGMSLSSRLTDPDEQKPKLLRLKNKKVESHVPMKSVIEAQCAWINRMHSLQTTLVDC